MRYTFAAVSVSVLLATGAAASPPDAAGTLAPDGQPTGATLYAQAIPVDPLTAVAGEVAVQAGTAAVEAVESIEAEDVRKAADAAGQAVEEAGAAAGEAVAAASETAVAAADTAIEAVAETEHTLDRLTDRLAAAKTSLDDAIAGLISASGLDRTDLSPNQVYGVMAGAVGGALLADALGASGLATLGLTVTTGALGGYLGGGDTLETASAAEPLDGLATPHGTPQ